jgi:hypothetical protein
MQEEPAWQKPKGQGWLPASHLRDGFVVGERDLRVLHHKLAHLAAVVCGAALHVRLATLPLPLGSIRGQRLLLVGAAAVHLEQATVLLALGQHTAVFPRPCAVAQANRPADGLRGHGVDQLDDLVCGCGGEGKVAESGRERVDTIVSSRSRQRLA